MPQSYSSLWVHLIWSIKHREPILLKEFRKEVFKVMDDIANEHEIFLDRINGIEDHVHLLVRLRTDQAIADIVKTIKGNSWEHFKEIEDKYVTWQDGYAAFTVSPRHINQVRNYIDHQEKHHAEKSFVDELKEIKRSANGKKG